MTRADALIALLTFPFVVTVVTLIAAAVWLAWQHEARQDFTPSPDVEQARRDLRAKAWGGEGE
jgi:hypothetical protein